MGIGISNALFAASAKVQLAAGPVEGVVKEAELVENSVAGVEAIAGWVVAGVWSRSKPGSASRPRSCWGGPRAGGEWRRGRGQAEVAEDGIDGLGSGDEGDDAHVGAAVGAEQGEDLVDAGEEAGPAGAGGGALRQVGRGGSGRFGLGSVGRVGQGVVARAGDGVGRRLAVVATEGDDTFAQARIGCKDAVVAMAVDAGEGGRAQ
jgi:hypothetical protein